MTRVRLIEKIKRLRKEKGAALTPQERQLCRVQILADIIGDDMIGITASDADTGRDIIEDALIRLADIEAWLRVQDKLRAAREYMKAAGYGK